MSFSFFLFDVYRSFMNHFWMLVRSFTAYYLRLLEHGHLYIQSVKNRLRIHRFFNKNISDKVFLKKRKDNCAKPTWILKLYLLYLISAECLWIICECLWYHSQFLYVFRRYFSRKVQCQNYFHRNFKSNIHKRFTGFKLKKGILKLILSGPGSYFFPLLIN